MNAPRTLRSHLFWGAVIGAAGMLLLSHVFFLYFIRYMRVFRMTHGAIAASFALALIVIGILQVRKGLSPFDQLRARLNAMRKGQDVRIEGRYPGEVQPLVNDLNALLDHRERIARRAQAAAGDLAHGLKTPLAV